MWRGLALRTEITLALAFKGSRRKASAWGLTNFVETLDDPVDTLSIKRDVDDNNNAFIVNIGRTGESFIVSSDDLSVDQLNDDDDLEGDPLVPSADIETTALGSGSDIFIGGHSDDYIETGGGNDRIYAGSGDDVVIVQSSDLSLDTNADNDEFIEIDVFVDHSSGSPQYVFDGFPDQYLNLEGEKTYRFIQADPSNVGHRIGFAADSGGYQNVVGDPTTFVSSINGNAGEPGAFTEIFAPSGQQIYFSETHPSMSGSLSVFAPPGSGGIEQWEQEANGNEGEVEVDTGIGDDRVVVEEGFSGTLFVKNGAGSNILEFEALSNMAAVSLLMANWRFILRTARRSLLITNGLLMQRLVWLRYLIQVSNT